MRLKVRGDTFFLPSSDGSVYFRNNIGSFRMEGSTIGQWIEKLMPVFNGEHSMHELTDGLLDQYQRHVYEIAEVLLANGYVRDVSRDLPHQLQESVLKKYASQIEFLDSFEGSGKYRFQRYRQSAVLAIGSGSFFVSLVKCLLESGLPRIHMRITNPETTNRKRILELAEHARRSDQEVKVDEIAFPPNGDVDWRTAVQPFDALLFVSDEGGEPELRMLQQICKEENKVLLPAIMLKQAGIAGPLFHPDSEGGWESARRRLHRLAIDKDPRHHVVSSAAEAMLANVIVFEWLKTATEVAASALKNKVFLLDLETLEGNWHPFLPHPLANGHSSVSRIEQLELLLERESEEKAQSTLMEAFSRLTSRETGILHVWEEGELRQLPLSQCRVQPTDPLTDGPADLLPEIICNGINHEEARREAGLAGIEAYVSRMGLSPANEAFRDEYVGVGVGESIAEGICRGLQKCLTAALVRKINAQEPSVRLAQLVQNEDERSRFYWSTLRTMQGEPTIGFGEEIFGFPVAWVRANGCWYGAVGFNKTKALRGALQHALLEIQNGAACATANAISTSSVNVTKDTPLSVAIPSGEPIKHRQTLQSALDQIKRSRQQLIVFDFTTEAFLKEELAGAFGVLLREEDEA
ncbi:putative thiazole-containing bacteriocin maturation protein [Paenibacillus glycanilyticus]|nr:putative thiazole-containing bacteriocin maturation protein [Paenibacillus glycanilyticus]